MLPSLAVRASAGHILQRRRRGERGREIPPQRLGFGPLVLPDSLSGGDMGERARQSTLAKRTLSVPELDMIYFLTPAVSVVHIFVLRLPMGTRRTSETPWQYVNPEGMEHTWKHNVLHNIWPPINPSRRLLYIGDMQTKWLDRPKLKQTVLGGPQPVTWLINNMNTNINKWHNLWLNY
jgi:hypothetical protein